jgi:sugar lactone lactonase YvrE
MPDGSLLVVSMRDQRILRWTAETGATLHADVSEHCGGHLNDMVVDQRGRAYAGNFGFDLMAGADPVPAALIRVDPDGTASPRRTCSSPTAQSSRRMGRRSSSARPPAPATPRSRSVTTAL